MIESLVVLAALGTIALIAVPNMREAQRRADLDRLARRLRADILTCRSESAVKCRNVALVFTRSGGRLGYSIVSDGDADGVQRRDLARHVDVELRRRVWVDDLSARAQMGVPEGWSVPDPSGSGKLLAGSGLRAGRAEMVSFSPAGGATPASLYFHDGEKRMVAVRVFGGTGRVVAMRWERGWPRWRKMPL